MSGAWMGLGVILLKAQAAPVHLNMIRFSILKDISLKVTCVSVAAGKAMQGSDVLQLHNKP